MTLHGGTRGDKRTYVFPKQSSALTLPLEAVKTGPNFTTELIALHTLLQPAREPLETRHHKLETMHLPETNERRTRSPEGDLARPTLETTRREQSRECASTTGTLQLAGSNA
jgi:hypothetical protein